MVEFACTTKDPGAMVLMLFGLMVPPGGGVGMHCGTLQHPGSLGSGTSVQPAGTLKNWGHLIKNKFTEFIISILLNYSC